MLVGKVIIVEDQPNFRKGLVKMIELGQPEWNVVGEASNGQDALRLLDRFKPDLVLTDINMPIMNGIDFISLLRKNYPDLLVIILTGYREFEHAQAAVKLGVFDFLTKPCSEQDVHHVLHKAFLKLNERHSKPEPFELSLEEKRISDLETQFISAILTGEANIVQQVLDQFIANLKTFPSYKLKLEALSLAVALHRTARNYFDIEECGLYNKTSVDMTDLTSDKIDVWTNELSAGFMKSFQKWQFIEK